MPLCTSCGDHYRHNQFNQTSECEECAYKVQGKYSFDDEDTLEVESLLNPTGITRARFSDE